jgi:hypothetical protein
MFVLIVKKTWKIIHGGEYSFSLTMANKICDSQWKINGGQKGFCDYLQDMWLKMEITWRIIGIINDCQQHARFKMEMNEDMHLHGLQ